MLTVTVADCIPVYLAAPRHGGIALLHAGWRGTAAGILERGVEILSSRVRCEPFDIIMHCGVGISGDEYEVGSEVMEGLGLAHRGEGTLARRPARGAGGAGAPNRNYGYNSFRMVQRAATTTGSSRTASPAATMAAWSPTWVHSVADSLTCSSLQRGLSSSPVGGRVVLPGVDLSSPTDDVGEVPPRFFSTRRGSMTADPLLDLVSNQVEGAGFELVDLRRTGTPARPVLSIRADRPDATPGHGITTEECARLSRAIEAALEAAALVGPRYVLEVSSPGVERPVRFPDHWRRVSGAVSRCMWRGCRAGPSPRSLPFRRTTR